MSNEVPLWEVFIRPRNGLADKHAGTLHAARDVYTRRGEGNSIWIVPWATITAGDPDQPAENFEPTGDKIYRHPTFYEIPEDVGRM